MSTRLVSWKTYGQTALVRHLKLYVTFRGAAIDASKKGAGADQVLGCVIFCITLYSERCQVLCRQRDVEAFCSAKGAGDLSGPDKRFRDFIVSSFLKVAKHVVKQFTLH